MHSPGELSCQIFHLYFYFFQYDVSLLSAVDPWLLLFFFFLQIKKSCSKFCACILAIDLLKNNRILYISQMQEASNDFVIPILCISASQWQYKFYQMAMCSNYYRVL